MGHSGRLRKVAEGLGPSVSLLSARPCSVCLRPWQSGLRGAVHAGFSGLAQSVCLPGAGPSGKGAAVPWDAGGRHRRPCSGRSGPGSCPRDRLGEAPPRPGRLCGRASSARGAARASPPDASRSRPCPGLHRGAHSTQAGDSHVQGPAGCSVVWGRRRLWYVSRSHRRGLQWPGPRCLCAVCIYSSTWGFGDDSGVCERGHGRVPGSLWLPWTPRDVGQVRRFQEGGG